MDKNIEESLKGLGEAKKKVEQFGEVLEKIEHADSKKKLLWREIYENYLLYLIEEKLYISLRETRIFKPNGDESLQQQFLLL